MTQGRTPPFCALVVAVLATLLGAPLSLGQAISPDFLGVVNNGNGTFTYQYNILLDHNTQLNGGEQFVLYDVAGLTGTPTFTDSATIPGSYIVSLANTGPYPPNTLLLGTDSPTLSNVALTYGGGAPSNNTGTSQNLGRLDLVSTFPLATGGFLAFAANSRNADNGQPAGNQSFVQGPVVPEPSSAAIGLSVLGLVALRRVRRPVKPD